jgi:hypothetical protein
VKSQSWTSIGEACFEALLYFSVHHLFVYTTGVYGRFPGFEYFDDTLFVFSYHLGDIYFCLNAPNASHPSPCGILKRGVWNQIWLYITLEQLRNVCLLFLLLRYEVWVQHSLLVRKPGSQFGQSVHSVCCIAVRRLLRVNKKWSFNMASFLDDRIKYVDSEVWYRLIDFDKHIRHVALAKLDK